jgi:hypothetical protein
MRETNHQSELLMQLFLDDTTLGLWCLATSGLKEVQTDSRALEGCPCLPSYKAASPCVRNWWTQR